MLHEYVYAGGCSFAELGSVEVVREGDLGVCASNRFKASKFTVEYRQSLNSGQNTLLHLHAHHHMGAIDVGDGQVAHKLMISETLVKSVSAGLF